MMTIAAFVRSLITIAAALFPTATLLGVLAQHPDDVVKIVMLCGNALSAVWLYLRRPHPVIEDPVLDALHWIKTKVARSVKP